MTGALGEFLGTMILILLGDGVVAGVLLKRSKGENAGWLAITAGWAFAVVCGVFTAAAFGAPGHLNPAVTAGALAIGATSANEAWSLIGAQLAGAFVGAILVWIHYLPHWAETPEPDFKLGIFCTIPAIRQPLGNFISEVIGTFVLVFVAEALVNAKAATGMTPYLIGILVWGIGLSLGGTTGYAINPARDLGPRIAHFLLPIPGKRDSDWGYSWVPVLGPLVGGVIAARAFALLGQVMQ
ncbi:MAG TPA: MIP/aquaporin family protein [Gemmataceae bacterium]|nr:MIP/aquaporin family protein [Gemmataceae bacterium]